MIVPFCSPGTVEGGTQLQGYRDVGMLTHASNASLSLSHNTKVYVTVMATNAAGLHSVTSSQPVLIDITPPELSRINDGLGKRNKREMLYKI